MIKSHVYIISYEKYQYSSISTYILTVGEVVFNKTDFFVSCSAGTSCNNENINGVTA